MDSSNTTMTFTPSEASKLDLGALLLGCVFQAIFYGNSLSLLWRYLTKGRAPDPRWYSIAIVFGSLLCTLSVFVTTNALWYFVFGKLFRQGSPNPPWTVDFFPLVIVVVAALVRVLYVYRLWRLCQVPDYFRWRTLFMSMLILTDIFTMVDLVATAVLCIRLYITDRTVQTNSHEVNRPIFSLAFATGISADIILTVLMSLASRHARQEVYRPNCFADSLIVYTVQTGLLPCLMEVAGVIAFVAMPTSKLFIGFYVQVGVLYLTSLLSSLNTGRFVKKRVQQPICVNFSALDRVVADPGPPSARQSTSFLTVPLPSLAIDEDTHGIYMPDELYYAEEKELTPDIEQPPQQPEREPLATPYAYVMRPRAFTLPSFDRRPCT